MSLQKFVAVFVIAYCGLYWASAGLGWLLAQLVNAR